MLADCQGHPPATVSEEKKGSSQAAPRLYDLTTLQREANNRFGFPARRTLQIAQALYERHKMITYPRTDSRALPEDYIPTCREALSNLSGSLAPHAQKVLDEGWLRPNKRIFNNAQISDHFAIIPTAHEAMHLDESEAKVYDMIARRFIAVFYPAAEFDITTRHSVIKDHTFKTEGKVLTFSPAGSPFTAKPCWMTTHPIRAARRLALRGWATDQGENDRGQPPRGNHQAAAALHRGHAALRHGRRRQARR